MIKLLLLTNFILSTLLLHAQDTKKATQADADFHNKISVAFKKALPPTFRDWDVTLPDKEEEPMVEGAKIRFCEGTTCWRSHSSTGTYDGSQIHNEFYLSSQKQIQQINATDKEYIQKHGVLMNKFNNATKLEVRLYANVTSLENLTNCMPNGFQKLVPPLGWNSYYSSSGTTTCYEYQSNDNENTLDVSIFSMGVRPQIKVIKGNGLYLGKLHFSLNMELIKTYKVQNVILFIKGSKAAVYEFVKSVDTIALQKLLIN